MRLQSELDQAGVLDVVVVLRGLRPRVVHVLDLYRPGELLCDHPGDVAHRHRLGHLIEHPELASVGGVLDGEADAFHGVADIDQPPRLLAGSVNGQGFAEHGLDDEPVQHGSEDAVVVEPGRQPLIRRRLGGLLTVDDALVEIGGPQTPVPAGELDVV